MKTRTLLVSLTLLFTASVCFAGSPHEGTWNLNEGRSKLAPGMAKHNKVVYAAEGESMKVTVEGMDKDGKAFKSVWKGKFDGKAYRVKGHPLYDSIMYKVVNDHTNDIMAMKDGKSLWSGRITVSKDGKSRVVEVNGTDANGKKFKSKAVYDKA